MTDTPCEAPDDLRARLIQKLREPVDHGGHDGWGSDGLHLSAADAIEAESMRADTAMTLLTAWQKRTYESEARETVLLAECDTLRAQLAETRDQLSATEHERSLVAAASARGITDCSTPIFQRVRNIVEYLEQAEAQLAASEGEIAMLADAIARFRHTPEDRHLWETEDGRPNIPALVAHARNAEACASQLAAAEASAESAEAQLRAQGWQPIDTPTLLPVWKCKACGCLWRDNLDDTVSLLNAARKSCASCELSTMEACALHWLIVVAPPITKESQPHE